MPKKIHKILYTEMFFSFEGVRAVKIYPDPIMRHIRCVDVETGEKDFIAPEHLYEDVELKKAPNKVTREFMRGVKFGKTWKIKTKYPVFTPDDCVWFRRFDLAKRYAYQAYRKTLRKIGYEKERDKDPDFTEQLDKIANELKISINIRNKKNISGEKVYIVKKILDEYYAVFAKNRRWVCIRGKQKNNGEIRLIERKTRKDNFWVLVERKQN